MVNPLIYAIVANRGAIVVACILWPLLLSPEGGNIYSTFSIVIVMLGVIIRLSEVLHILCIERSWIPRLSTTGARHYSRSGLIATLIRYPGLPQLNFTIRTIELLCGFTSPWATRAFVDAAGPTLASLLIAVAVSPCMAVEAWAARRAWRRTKDHEVDEKLKHSANGHATQPQWQRRKGVWPRIRGPVSKTVKTMWHSNVDALRFYASTQVWLPSLSVALTRSSALSMFGNTGPQLSLSGDGIALGQARTQRGIGYLFAVLGVIAFLRATSLSTDKDGGHRSSEEIYQMVDQGDDERDDTLAGGSEVVADGEAITSENTPHLGLPVNSTILGDAPLRENTVKVSQWSIIGYLIVLALAVITLFCSSALISKRTAVRVGASLDLSSLTAIIFIGFYSLSQLGWSTFDLSVLQLTQMLVPTRRAEFGGVEQALVGSASIVRLAVFPASSDFLKLRWPALWSLALLALISGAYTWWTVRWKKRH